jgi:hypothetical protein
MTGIIDGESGKILEWEIREPNSRGVKHDGKRYYTTTPTIYYVECKEAGCTFEHEGRNALALAAIHHDKSGHHVKVWCIRTIEYG